MPDLFSRLFTSITWRGVAIGLLLFVVTFAVSLAIVSFVLVKLPPTYFQRSHSISLWSGRHPGIRLTGVIVKNLLGILLVVLGILMSVPGVPGQGVLTILLGIMLLDFPGRRQLELRLVSRPRVLSAINRLRHRFGKPALVLD